MKWNQQTYRANVATMDAAVESVRELVQVDYADYGALMNRNSLESGFMYTLLLMLAGETGKERWTEIVAKTLEREKKNYATVQNILHERAAATKSETETV